MKSSPSWRRHLDRQKPTLKMKRPERTRPLAWRNYLLYEPEKYTWKRVVPGAHSEPRAIAGFDHEPDCFTKLGVLAHREELRDHGQVVLRRIDGLRGREPASVGDGVPNRGADETRQRTLR